MTATTEQRVNQVIQEKGGERLDSGWTSVEAKIHVSCANGHDWWVKAASILYLDSWCRACQNDKRRLGIGEARQYAEKHKGQCLSGRYVNTHTVLKWRCEKGHEFDRSLHSVKEGRWCSTCESEENLNLRRWSFEKALLRAEEQSGKHIGKCKNVSLVTTWQCENGHVFESTGRSIIKRSYFCPLCAKRPPTTMETIQAVCEARGGRCLSKTYEGLSTFMEFECVKGHRWNARWRNVGSHGSWCPTCARQRGSLASLQSIAQQRGGEVLSNEYVNCNKAYKWRCKNGHDFKATTYRARRSWCKKCPPAGEITMSAHELVAHRWGGELVNKENKRWRCADGHEFEASLSTAALVWCPRCRNPNSAGADIAFNHHFSSKKDVVPGKNSPGERTAQT